MDKKERKSFILYCNFENQFKLLSMEERGILISAIFEYARERDVSAELPPLVNMAFSLIKDTMDRDYEEYVKKCEINAINGRKGGRPRKTEEDAAPIFSAKTERYFKKPKKAYNDNYNHNGNDSGNDNEKSFDSDEFFEAACRRAREEFGIKEE